MTARSHGASGEVAVVLGGAVVRDEWQKDADAGGADFEISVSDWLLADNFLSLALSKQE